MSGDELPQIYLITPPEIESSTFPDRLSRVLDMQAVACVRLGLSSQDADDVGRAADALREVCHGRDVALVIDTHAALVEPHGLDGVHLADGARSVRKVRKALGADAIVGAFCGASRHDGMTAAEQGADYVSFGPVAATALGDGTRADAELFAWWSEMIEVPVVAEGGWTPELVARLAPVTDFLAIGPEIWGRDDPGSALSMLLADLSFA